jgi:hypothetical protein
MRHLCIALLLPNVLGVSLAHADDPPKAANAPLNEARRAGWAMATMVLEKLESSDEKHFPGIVTWVADFRKATKGIDAKVAPDKWPAFDVDAQVTHNPKFWRAYFEVAPGDPGLMLLHAGLLLSAGECNRASYILQLAWQRPGVPKEVQDGFDQLLLHIRKAVEPSHTLVEAGIKLHDQGDYDAAIAKYKEALALWPQCGFAQYEMGLSMHHRQLKAAGLKPATIVNPKDERYKQSAEVKGAYAQARQHDPFQWNAWQGDDPEVIHGFMAFAKEGMRAWQPIATDRKKQVPDATMKSLADALQEAGVHELAVVARQIFVARRGRYDPKDHPFLTTSLRKLAPGEPVETTLKLLNGGELAVRQIVATARPETPKTTGAFSMKQVVIYVEPQELEDRLGENGLNDYADFIKLVNDRAADHWDSLAKTKGQTMMLIVFVRPGGKARFDFTFSGEAPDEKTLTEARKTLEKLKVPQVKKPMLAGLQVDLWGGPDRPMAGPPPDNLLFPKDWQDSAKKKGITLKVPLNDEVMELIWPKN